jgi:Pregnancy-associated plasma protein-A/Secretion system C-terminal sorting domain
MRLAFTLILICFTIFVNAQRCGTPQYILQNSLAFTTSTTSNLRIAAGTRDTLNNEVIVVPVVIHVLYNNSAQNISDQQVLSQITVLNNDYRRLNDDTVNTPEAFKKVAADTRIVFCVAKVDPNGNFTTGIIHKHTGEGFFLTDDGMKFSSSGGDDAWDSKKYLNIWVCNLFGRTLGYGVLPGSPAAKDGVVIQYDVFGTIGNVSAPFNKGRTTTHEIGHWLGLRHTWGDAVCGDDGIADTPPQQSSSSGCPTFPQLSTCSINFSGDMFMNYMDFTDDGCMNMFTQDQKNEMRSLFALGNSRNSFLNSSVCDSSLAQHGALPADTVAIKTSIEISVYPNPFASELNITYKNASEKMISGSIKLYDITGKIITTQTIQSQKTSINVSNLPSGIYILKVFSSDKQQVFKLIK